MAPPVPVERRDDSRGLVALPAAPLGVTIVAGSILWTWMYNSTGGSVLAVAVFHAGINAMGRYHPADLATLTQDGIPDPWLTFLAEATSAVPLVTTAVLLVDVYGGERLANREVPGPEHAGLD